MIIHGVESQYLYITNSSESTGWYHQTYYFRFAVIGADLPEATNKTMHRSGRSAPLDFRNFFGGHSVMVAVTPEEKWLHEIRCRKSIS